MAWELFLLNFTVDIKNIIGVAQTMKMSLVPSSVAEKQSSVLEVQSGLLTVSMYSEGPINNAMTSTALMYTNDFVNAVPYKIEQIAAGKCEKIGNFSILGE